MAKKRRRRADNAKKASDDASALKEKLESSCREGTDGDLSALQEIIDGGPAARNAQSRIKALALKWGYGFGAPKQPIALGNADNELVLRVKRDRS